MLYRQSYNCNICVTGKKFFRTRFCPQFSLNLFFFSNVMTVADVDVEVELCLQKNPFP